jgi:hypothetical protein
LIIETQKAQKAITVVMTLKWRTAAAGDAWRLTRKVANLVCAKCLKKCEIPHCLWTVANTVAATAATRKTHAVSHLTATGGRWRNSSRITSKGVDTSAAARTAVAVAGAEAIAWISATKTLITLSVQVFSFYLFKKLN